MSRGDGRFHPVDVVVLRHLADAHIDYPTCIAVHRGVDRRSVERRCEALADDDLVEPISPEVVYRITAAGRRALESARTEASERRDDAATPVRSTRRERVERSDVRTAGGQ